MLLLMQCYISFLYYLYMLYLAQCSFSLLINYHCLCAVKMFVVQEAHSALSRLTLSVFQLMASVNSV